MTASGGNIIGCEIRRDKQCPHEADLRRSSLRNWGKPLFGGRSARKICPLAYFQQRGRNARKIIQWMIFSEGRAAAQGVYVAGGRSARKMIQWIIFSEGRAAAQGRQPKVASYINFWP